VFIGPNDLAQSLLGYVPARGDEPEFVAAIEKIASAAKAAGKWSGRLVNNGALAKEAKGTFDTVAITGDTKVRLPWPHSFLRSLLYLADLPSRLLVLPQALQNWYIAELETARS
jgi:hypothetical protein